MLALVAFGLGVLLLASAGRAPRAAIEGENQPADPPPTHGRTAVWKYKGIPKWFKIMSKVSRWLSKSVINYFTGGSGGDAFEALQKKLMEGTKELEGKEFAAWLNKASNEEAITLYTGQLLGGFREARKHKIKKALDMFARLGITEETLTKDAQTAVPAAFRLGLVAYKTALWAFSTDPLVVTKRIFAKIDVPWGAALHYLQAAAIIIYGSPKVLATLDEQLATKPKWKKNLPHLDELIEWADSVSATLEQSAATPPPEGP